MIDRNRSISMLEVAQTLGLSKSAVSRALNNKSGVSDETRELVLKTCDQMGYRINPNIQDLVRRSISGVTKNIAFVLVGRLFADPSYAGFIDGMAKGTEENNYHLVFAHLSGEESMIYDLPPILRDRRVDGILVTGLLNKKIIDLLKALGIPYVIIGNYDIDLITDSTVVEVNVDACVHEMVKVMKSLGKTRLAYVSYYSLRRSSRLYYNAYTKALEANGLPLNEDIMYLGEGDLDEMYNKLKNVFQDGDLPFDALFCFDHRLTSKVSYLIVDKFGLDKPTDIVVATVKPYALSSYMPLSPIIYIKANEDLMAYNAANILMDHVIRGRDFTASKVALQPPIEVITG